MEKLLCDSWYCLIFTSYFETILLNPYVAFAKCRYCISLNGRCALLTRPISHFFPAYGGTGNEWEEYSRYLNPEGLEMPPVSIFLSRPSFVCWWHPLMLFSVGFGT